MPTGTTFSIIAAHVALNPLCRDVNGAPAASVNAAKPQGVFTPDAGFGCIGVCATITPAVIFVVASGTGLFAPLNRQGLL